MATSKEKKLAEAKARAAKDAAKKTKENKKSSKADKFNYAKMGISKEQWNSLDPSSKTAIGAIGDVLSKQMEQNQTIPTVLDTKTLNDLWSKAEADPTIASYYGEELSTAKTDFQQNIQAMQTTLGAQEEQLKQQQEADTKALQEAHAAAGTAYSGFRGKAKESLKGLQTGVIKSTQAQIKQNLQQMTSAFEKRYGTGALTATGIPQYTSAGILGNISATPYGNIAGTQATDILGAKENLYQNLQQKTLQQQGAFETKPSLPQ